MFGSSSKTQADDSGVEKTEVCRQALENGRERRIGHLPSRFLTFAKQAKETDGKNSARKTRKKKKAIFSPPLYVPGLRGCDWLGVMAWFLEFGFQSYLVDVRKLLVFKLVLNVL